MLNKYFEELMLETPMEKTFGFCILLLMLLSSILLGGIIIVLLFNAPIITILTLSIPFIVYFYFINEEKYNDKP